MPLIHHEDVIKWKHFPRYWPFGRGIHRSPVNSPHKGQWRGALMFSLICVWTNIWVNNGYAGDLRRYYAYYDVIVTNVARHTLLRLLCRSPFQHLTSTVYWCIASKLKAPWNFYWMSNMFLWVEIFLFFVCYHVVPKRHSQLDYELNGL